MSRDKASGAVKQRPLKQAKPTACPALYQVVAECKNERQQRELYAELKAKGYRCRLLNL